MYKISVENTKEIRKEMGATKKACIYKRLEAVALRGEGFKNSEVASITGYNANYVVELCKRYIEAGLEGLKTDKRKGGNHHNMTHDEEKEFLAEFEESAKNGQVTNIGEIAAAYDNATGKNHESKSTVYYLLHKYGWRIITPQKAHPGKASEAEIEASKKLTSS